MTPRVLQHHPKRDRLFLLLVLVAVGVPATVVWLHARRRQQPVVTGNEQGIERSDAPPNRLDPGDNASRSPRSAWGSLVAAVASKQIPPTVVLDAWLERENDRQDLPPGRLADIFAERVAAASRLVAVRKAGSLSARLGTLKQGLLARRNLRYNRDASTLADFLLNDRLQCFSGSVAVILAWIATTGDAPNRNARPVFVHTKGHVQPGLLVGGTLIIVEATATDSTATRRELARAKAIRVTDAVAELALTLMSDKAPGWLRERALIVDAAPKQTARNVPRNEPNSLDKSVFAFGVAEVPAGDLSLLDETGSAPLRYAATRERPEPPGAVECFGPPVVAPRLSVQTFKLVFCEDVFPWNGSRREELLALERHLVRLLGTPDLPELLVFLVGDLALVADPRTFSYREDSAVRLFLRHGDRWRMHGEGDVTIETVWVEHQWRRAYQEAETRYIQTEAGCARPLFEFCALKPLSPE
ncbi:hypothetical protein ACFL6C_08470 [Myxococcota bacterium]